MIGKYHFIPLDEAQKPPKAQMIYHFHKRYWCVHPELGVVFWEKGFAHPQCNANEEIARRLAPDWAQVVYIDSVFVPLNIQDYMER